MSTDVLKYKWKAIMPKESNGWWEVVLARRPEHELVSAYGFDAAKVAAVVAQTPDMYKLICRLYNSGKMPDKFKEAAEKIIDAVEMVQ